MGFLGGRAVLRCHETEAWVSDEGKGSMRSQSWCHFVGRGGVNRHSCLCHCGESHIAKRTVLNSEKETGRVGERPRRMSS